MSKRLYYTDSYTTQFDAAVAERLDSDGQPAVVLDRSFFYPTSGGQPHDGGRLGDAAVTDVFVRKEDGAVVHVLDRALTADTVSCSVDWHRRFDHMQHHCGQHILSRAFIEIVAAPTMSFHMGEGACTIDIDATELTAEQIKNVETLANSVIQENRPVHIRQVTLDEAQSLPIRKLPPVAPGELVRLVDIDSFDLTACGGTHPACTGEIGLIKVTKLERRKKMLRVSFLCGTRAIADYDHKLSVVRDLTSLFSTGADNLAESVEKMQQEAKLMNREVRLLRKEKMVSLAQAFERQKDKFEQVGNASVFAHVFTNGESVDELRTVATALCETQGRIVLLGSAGDPAMLLFRSSAGEACHMGNLLRSVLKHIDSTSGGGRADQAQGGGVAATAENVLAAVQSAKQNLAK